MQPRFTKQKNKITPQIKKGIHKTITNINNNSSALSTGEDEEDDEAVLTKVNQLQVQKKNVIHLIYVSYSMDSNRFNGPTGSDDKHVIGWTTVVVVVDDYF